jgi:hypothetical protein
MATAPTNTYTTAPPQNPLDAVCPPQGSYTTTDLSALFMWPGNKPGVAATMLTPNRTTNRPDAATVTAHVDKLVTDKTLPELPTLPVSTGDSGTTDEANMKAFIDQDAKVRENLRNEYCFYEARYKYALGKFLEKATSGVASNNSEALALLETTKTLNMRVNTVLEVMKELANRRVQRTNDLKSSIDTSNTTINERLAKMRSNYALLSSDDAIIRTQREMVRYTEEKNRFNANQISLWAAANVVALAVIFYVYRN